MSTARSKYDRPISASSHTLTTRDISGRGGGRRLTRSRRAHRALIALAAFSLLLFTGATAAAEDPVERTLVGNMSHTGNSYCWADADCAQGFTTGGNADGYRLTKVVLLIDVLKPNEARSVKFKVGVWSSVDDSPGEPLAYFLARGPVSDDLNTFDYDNGPGGYWLDPDTEYFVVLDVDSPTRSSHLRWVRTTSASEDPGASSGWSINDGHRARSQALDDRPWHSRAYSLKTRLIGYEADLSSPPEGPTGAVYEGKITQRLTTIDESGVITETGETHEARICWISTEYGLMRIIGGSGPCP